MDIYMARTLTRENHALNYFIMVYYKTISLKYFEDILILFCSTEQNSKLFLNIWLFDYQNSVSVFVAASQSLPL